MADDMDIARQDLAFLRSLVEDGRPMLRPLGVVLGLGGLIQAVSALRFWAVAEGWMAWPEALRPLMGLDGVIIQLLAMLAVAWVRPAAMRLPPRSASPATRAIHGAINALAWALGAAALGLFIAARQSGVGEPLATGLPILLFALASATWQVVFAVYRRRWAFSAAIASALFALGVGFTAGVPSEALVVAAGLLLCIAAPGFAMMRQSIGR